MELDFDVELLGTGKLESFFLGMQAFSWDLYFYAV